MKLRRPLFALLAAALLALAFVAGRSCGPTPPEQTGHEEHPAADAPAAAPEVWTCAMHPSVRLPEPGQCPICFMDLIPANADGGGDDLGPRTLRLTESARKLAEIETAPVKRMSVAHEVSMVGKVAFDETRLAYLTAWVGGRLDRLFVDYTGVNVRRGDHMVEIYSPTLYTAQQELLHDGARADLRYLRELLETRASLGHLLLAQRRADEARVEASAALDQLEQQLARWQARADGADEAVDVGPPDGQPDGPPDGRRDDRAERPFGRGRREGERDGRRERGGRRFRRVGMFAPALPELVRRLEDAQLEQRLDELDARITRPR